MSQLRVKSVDGEEFNDGIIQIGCIAVVKKLESGTLNQVLSYFISEKSTHFSITFSIDGKPMKYGIFKFEDFPVSGLRSLSLSNEHFKGNKCLLLKIVVQQGEELHEAELEICK